MTTAGYTGRAAAAENLAAGYTTPEAVMASWMTSPYGHRDAILSTSYWELGVGYYYQLE